MTRDFIQFFGLPDSKTQLRLTRDIIMSHYQKAEAEWRDFIAHLDSEGYLSHAEAQQRSALKAEDNLAAWLEGLHIEGDDQDPLRNTHCSHPTLNTSNAAMLRCSYCHNPSAVLRKCGGCSKARYVECREPYLFFRLPRPSGIATPPVRSCIGQSTRLRASKRRTRPDKKIKCFIV